jgi:predicted NUDIX family NTP pyrophosphohydrolase
MDIVEPMWQGVHDGLVTRRSAGILLYRRGERGIEVLLGHPGGPYFTKKDAGSWSIPKGEPDDGEDDLFAIACREFAEETGHAVPESETLDLGSIVQKGGKVVFGWAVEGDLDPATARSNEFEMVWPPGSGTRHSFPEIDRVEWFDPVEARLRVKASQIPLIERLEAALGPTDG